MSTPEDDDSGTRIDREAILARRRRFVAAALTGLTTSTLATACPCLKVLPPEPAEPKGDGQPKDDGDPLEDASPEEGGAEPREAEGGGEAEPGAGAVEADAMQAAPESS